MFAPAVLAIALTASHARQVVSLPIHHRAVGPIMLRLAPDSKADAAGYWRSPLAPGLKLRADTRANAVLAEGPAEQIEDLKRMLPMFDIAPMRTAMTVVYGVPSFGLRTEQAVSVANDDRYTASEEAAEFGLSVRPRINGDGTVTLFVGVRRGETKVEFVARVKVGWSLYLKSPYLVAKALGHEPSELELKQLDPLAIPNPEADKARLADMGVLVWIKVNDLVSGTPGLGLQAQNPAKQRN